jgi:enamine deaminase RidA (YjgF/YER057c/UK114 family)
VKPEDRLQELNLVLPSPPNPLGAYVPAVEAGGLLFVSGMLPVAKQQPVWTGQLGREFGVAEGCRAAKLAALNGLAVARAALGSLNRIRRLARLTIHIFATPDFGEHAKVADGASELLARCSRMEAAMHGWRSVQRRCRHACQSNWNSCSNLHK